MADFLDFLLSSPTKSPLPIEITSATTLQDIIAATIQSDATDSTDNSTDNSATDSTPDQTNNSADDDDDEALAAAILAEATAQEPEPTTPTTQRSYSATSPASESRLADSLFGLLGPPPPEKPVNPAYNELQLLIKSELKQQTLPETLLSLLKPKVSVFSREQQLQHQFSKLEPYYPHQVQQLSSFFKYQSAVIETERYQSLHQQANRPHLRDSTNAKFDEHLHQVIDRVQLSVDNLEQTVNQTTTTTKPRPVTTRPSSLKSRPVLSRRSVQLMEEWYQLNIAHPYPDSAVIQSIAQQGTIREEQVKKWFANKRSRSQNTHARSVIHSRKMSTKYQRNLYQPY